jgi:hypothetical protein
VPFVFYVNHWPSRFSGAGSSNPKRIAAASMLAASVKDLVEAKTDNNIVIMGDFNDEPRDESMQAIGKILDYEHTNDHIMLINLSVKTALTEIDGTLKHQGTWSVFDQFLVSGSIFSGTGGCKLLSEKAEVFRAGFLLEADITYTGVKPFRTYSGPAWRDGFSDHLPVSILLGKTGK